MTSSVSCSRLVPRSASNQSTHCYFSAAPICSSVHSGFFPPQPLGLPGGKRQPHQARGHMTHQPHIVPPLEIPQPDLPLARPQAVLHIPTAEPDSQQPAQRCRPRRVGDEILLLARPDVARPDQPVGPFATAGHPHPRRLGFPDRVPLRLVVQPETPPRLLREGRAVPHQVIGPVPRLGWPWRTREAVKRPGHLADVTLLTLVAAGGRLRCHCATAPKGRPFWVSGCAPC